MAFHDFIPADLHWHESRGPGGGRAGAGHRAGELSVGNGRRIKFSARFDDCLEQGTALLQLARELGKDSQELEALRVVATVSFFRGDFVPVKEHAEAGIALHNPQRHRELAFVYGANPQVVCSLYAALSMWALGQPEHAEALGCKAIRVRSPAEFDAAFAKAEGLMEQHQVPVVMEFILERVTNIAMGTEIDGVNEFEDVLCLDPSLTLENGWVSMNEGAEYGFAVESEKEFGC
jgi:hypothetical protein